MKMNTKHTYNNVVETSTRVTTLSESINAINRIIMYKTIPTVYM